MITEADVVALLKRAEMTEPGEVSRVPSAIDALIASGQIVKVEGGYQSANTVRPQ